MPDDIVVGVTAPPVPVALLHSDLYVPKTLNDVSPMSNRMRHVAASDASCFAESSHAGATSGFGLFLAELVNCQLRRTACPLLPALPVALVSSSGIVAVVASVAFLHLLGLHQLPADSISRLPFLALFLVPLTFPFSRAGLHYLRLLGDFC